MRHASLLPAVCRDSTITKILWSQPLLTQQHLLILLPGRQVSCSGRPTIESLIKFIMTDNFCPSTRTSPSTRFYMTRPAWPTLLANDSSRFCFLKYAKPAHEHHLQVLPARPSLVPANLPGLRTEH